MALYDNLDTYFGKPVVDFKKAGDVTDFEGKAVRLRCTYDETETISDFMAELLDQPGIGALEALVIGLWMEGGDSYEVSPAPALELMVVKKDKLPNLRALFVGDIISEENEMSWIGQGDTSALWTAFPKLEMFGARGSDGLHLGKINHGKLKHLALESGGLPKSVAQEAMQSNAPIEHLELWLGDENYGASTSVSDFEPLLDGELFPDLHYLGLRNCEYADDLAAAVARSTLLGRLESLDLSMGALTDKGAKALLDSGQLGHLKLLDLTHHYMSSDMMKALAAVAPGLKADEQLEPDVYQDETYYSIAVSE